MNIHDHPTKKIGVIARPQSVKTVKLSQYIDLSTIPVPPAEVNWEIAAFNSMQMFMNDKIGDCAVAGFLHHKELVVQAAKMDVDYDDSFALKLYQEGTAAENNGKGYDPTQGDGESNPTDSGLVLVQFLEYLRSQNLILAHAEVDLTNDKEVQAARYLFGGIYRSFALPSFVQNFDYSWYIPNPALDLGNRAIGSWGNHCVNDKAHFADGSIQITSWGTSINVEKEFVDMYQAEGHIIIYNESATAFNNFSKSNLALNDLITDLNTLAKK